MTRQAPKARTILWGSAALALGLLTAPLYAQDKPKDHADGPAAAYEPSMTTLGQLQSTITREGLASPSVIVIGDVVRGIQAMAHGEDAAPVAGTRSRAV